MRCVFGQCHPSPSAGLIRWECMWCGNWEVLASTETQPEMECSSDQVECVAPSIILEPHQVRSGPRGRRKRKVA